MCWLHGAYASHVGVICRAHTRIFGALVAEKCNMTQAGKLPMQQRCMQS